MKHLVSPGWSFSLGLVQNDEARFGLVFITMTGEMYCTNAEGTGVFLNGKPCRAEPPEELDVESVVGRITFPA